MSVAAATDDFRERLSKLEQKVEDRDEHTAEAINGLRRDVRDLRTVMEDDRDQRAASSKDYRLAFYALFGVIVSALIAAGGAIIVASMAGGS